MGRRFICAAICAIVICVPAQAALATGTASHCSVLGSGYKDGKCQTPEHLGLNGPIADPANSPFAVSAFGEGALAIKAVRSGVLLEIKLSELSGSGHIENKEEGAEGFTRAFGLVLAYKKASVASPAGLGCEVWGENGKKEEIKGGVETKELGATSKGLTKELKFFPSAGESEALLVFSLKGCSKAAFNHSYTLKGSIKGQPFGTQTLFGHKSVTEQGTLSLNGSIAGVEGNLELRNAAGEGIGLI